MANIRDAAESLLLDTQSSIPLKIVRRLSGIKIITRGSLASHIAAIRDFPPEILKKIAIEAVRAADSGKGHLTFADDFAVTIVEDDASDKAAPDDGIRMIHESSRATGRDGNVSIRFYQKDLTIDDGASPAQEKTAGAPAAPILSLTLRQADRPEQIIRVTRLEDFPLTIGRGFGPFRLAAHFDCRFVSREHLRFEIKGGRIMVKTLVRRESAPNVRLGRVELKPNRAVPLPGKGTILLDFSGAAPGITLDFQIDPDWLDCQVTTLLIPTPRKDAPETMRLSTGREHRPALAVLEVKFANGHTQAQPIASLPFEIGRSPGTPDFLVIRDGSISRSHMTLTERIEGGFRVRNPSAVMRSDVWIDGVEQPREFDWHFGTSITLGNHIVEILLREGEAMEQQEKDAAA
ncbi:MAG: hypothetical protein LBF93_11545 [Zoogloeaceae bacterium]|nr:hypothetical protein [Zoogloeaceae bacterium]